MDEWDSFLRAQRDYVVSQLYVAGHLVEADDGEIDACVDGETTTKTFGLSADAPYWAEAASAGVVAIQFLLDCQRESPDFQDRCFAAWSILAAGRFLDATINQNVKAALRVRGGKATRKWTKEIDKQARDLLKDLPKNIRDNEDAAAKRIAPKIGLSVSTVKRRLFNA